MDTPTEQQTVPKDVLPDARATGFLAGPVDPLRYDNQPFDPAESTGLLCSLIPAGSTVLDVGCGTGSVSRFVIEKCRATLTGLEPDPDRAAKAAQRGITVRCEGLSRETVATLGKFDVVMYADVLEHVPEPASFLEMTRSLLVPTGRVVISVPNIAHWSVRVNLLLGRFNYAPTGIMDATHLRWFTARTLKMLLEQSGFRLASLHFSAGQGLPIYGSRFLKYVKPGLRNPVIRLMTRVAPRLFGCQLVAAATLV